MKLYKIVHKTPYYDYDIIAVVGNKGLANRIATFLNKEAPDDVSIETEETEEKLADIKLDVWESTL